MRSSPLLLDRRGASFFSCVASRRIDRTSLAWTVISLSKPLKTEAFVRGQQHFPSILLWEMFICNTTSGWAYLYIKYHHGVDYLDYIPSVSVDCQHAYRRSTDSAGAHLQIQNPWNCWVHGTISRGNIPWLGMAALVPTTGRDATHSQISPLMDQLAMMRREFATVLWRWTGLIGIM